MSSKWIGGVLLGALWATAAWAQAPLAGGAVIADVRDRTGAARPGVTVTLNGVERRATWSRQTDAQGHFRFAPVDVGAYRLIVELDGFVTVKRQFELALGQTVALDVELQPAATASVQVTAETAVLDTARTDASHVLSPSEIDNLPLNGRNYLDLATLVPGVGRSVSRSTERFGETSAVPGTGLAVQAQRNTGNSVLIDGLSANDDAADLAGTFVTQEVVREFQVVTGGGHAEFGRAAAGVINIVTRSGGSTPQARAYAFGRSDALDARNAFAVREDPLSQRQYGATASGPAGPWTWFGNVEQTRLRRQLFVTIDPGDAVAVNAVLDHVGYPGPRLKAGDVPTTLNTTNLFGRVDRALAQGNRLALRYALYDAASANARNVGGLSAESRGTALANRDQMAGATFVRASGASVVLDGRVAVTRSRLDAPPNDLTGPAVTISGVASFGTATSSPTARELDTWEAAGSLTAARGAHMFKAGVDLLNNDARIAFPGALQGSYVFSSLASLTSGRYSTFQQAFGAVDQPQRNMNLGLFAQDEWRPHRRLTTTAGVRYDVQGLHRVVHRDLDNLGPRVGAAWTLDDRTVLRAAAGLYFDRIPLRALSNALQRDGEKYKVAVLAFGQPGAPAFPSQMAAFPAGLVTAITTVDPDIENARSTQTTVDVERQIGGRVSVSAGYLGFRGRGIILSRNVNAPTLPAERASALGIANLGRPDPHVGNVLRYESIGRSRSDALALSLRAAASRWGAHRASYTFARAFDDAGAAFFSTPQDNGDVAADWGPADSDVRHRLVVSGDLSLGAAFSPRLHVWHLAYIVAAASAPPYNVQTGTDRNNDTNVNDRPAGVRRNSARAWPTSTVDLRASWRRAFGRMTVEGIVEAFNVLNHTNRRIPNNIVGAGATPPAAFGLATAADDPRQVQLGVRVGF